MKLTKRVLRKLIKEELIKENIMREGGPLGFVWDSHFLSRFEVADPDHAPADLADMAEDFYDEAVFEDEKHRALKLGDKNTFLKKFQTFIEEYAASVAKAAADDIDAEYAPPPPIGRNDPGKGPRAPKPLAGAGLGNVAAAARRSAIPDQWAQETKRPWER